MTALKSATDLENVFAQLLNKSAREVVKVFEFSEEGGDVVASQLQGTYIDGEDWHKIHRACASAGGQSGKDEKSGRWFFRFPKAAAQSEPQRPSPEAPKHGPGPGEAAAAGQPATDGAPKDMITTAAPPPLPKPSTSATPSPSEWKPEYPAKDAPVTPGYYAEFPVDRILSSPFSFRSNVAEGIEDLMNEIHLAGRVIHPLTCRPAKRPGYVEVGPGERRLYAVKEMARKTIPINVGEYSDLEFDRLRLLENLARKDLTDLETARVLKYLMDKYPKEYPTQETLAQAFGKNPGWVSRHLSMLEIENMSILPRGNLEKVTEGQAREILAAPPEKRKEVAEEIARHIEAEGKPPSMADIRKVTRPDEGIRVKCARCGTPTYKPVEVDGQQYCQVCSAIVKSAPKKTESVPKPPISSQGVSSEPEPEPSVIYRSNTGEIVSTEPASPSVAPRAESEEAPEDKGPIDTGMLFECPECGESYTVIHVDKGKHRLQQITVMEEQKG